MRLLARARFDPTIDTRKKRGPRKALDRMLARLIEEAYAENARRDAAQRARALVVVDPPAAKGRR